ncbi:MAG: argininosuccinate lyase [Candidatus Bipolaricaulota bacterium]|nr:argininosuccinate lyase [Candidatus Bipolaricaulota bacterium]MCS7274459.1 argininosuccinate lyase [Candidatus Bipolaricaulota bacterium]MDW8110888.1 argininosuccinate lyase [Candidatus Bipolaricaulota bacterium]MDW8329345.1 argininosuccinate lyase [Candidatus Bipolaricaulota bacterium]
MKLWETGREKTDVIVERFTAQDDLPLDEALARYDVLGSLAHAAMLQKIGVLTAEEHCRLRGALLELLDQKLTLSVEDEDIHTKIENLLVARLGELGQKLHTGRSRNDQVLADLRLYAKERLQEIALELLALAEALAEFAQKHEFVPMPGYTHTRRAMPASVGLWAAAFSESLLDDVKLVKAVYELNDASPLGAAAGYGVPLALDRALTAELLGFKAVQRNALAAMNSRGKLEFATVSALGSVMLTIGRLADDLVWFSSEEFGFFEIPERFCTGSSLMPNKTNPDLLELIRARVARVVSAGGAVALVVHGLTSGYHRDLQETKEPFMKSLLTTRDCLAVLSRLIPELRVNEAKLRAACSAEIFAVDRVLEEVQRGVPFRKAYQNLKRELSALRVPNLKDALKKRAHLGGPGNLQLDVLKSEIERAHREWRVERERYLKTLDRLIHQ